MSISIYLKDQNHATETPAHHASRRLAVLIVAATIGRWLDAERKAVKLNIDQTWASVKHELRVREKAEVVVKTRAWWRQNAQGLRAEGPAGALSLFYPSVDMRTNGKELQKRLWRNADRVMSDRAI